MLQNALALVLVAGFPRTGCGLRKNLAPAASSSSTLLGSGFMGLGWVFPGLCCPGGCPGAAESQCTLSTLESL